MTPVPIYVKLSYQLSELRESGDCVYSIEKDSINTELDFESGDKTQGFTIKEINNKLFAFVPFRLTREITKLSDVADIIKLWAYGINEQPVFEVFGAFLNYCGYNIVKETKYKETN